MEPLIGTRIAASVEQQSQIETIAFNSFLNKNTAKVGYALTSIELVKNDRLEQQFE
jgi:hypothetical protein